MCSPFTGSLYRATNYSLALIVEGVSKALSMDLGKDPKSFVPPKIITGRRRVKRGFFGFPNLLSMPTKKPTWSTAVASMSISHPLILSRKRA